MCVWAGQRRGGLPKGILSRLLGETLAGVLVRLDTCLSLDERGHQLVDDRLHRVRTRPACLRQQLQACVCVWASPMSSLLASSSQSSAHPQSTLLTYCTTLHDVASLDVGPHHPDEGRLEWIGLRECGLQHDRGDVVLAHVRFDLKRGREGVSEIRIGIKEGRLLLQAIGGGVE